jgi:hypothetical protein
VVILAALALAATAAASASAAGPSPRPAAFALSAVGSRSALLLRTAPERVVRGAVVVRNLSSHPVTVRLQAADIRNASNGNADYVTTRLAGAGRWIRLAATAVRLAPNRTRKVAFTVHVPAVAHGASHYAGIVALDSADLTAATAQTKAKGRSFSFRRVNRQAIPLTIRLPGPLTRSLTLRSASLIVQPVGASIVLALRPTGGELIQATHVKLRVLRGSHTIFASASTLGQLFPGAPLAYRIPWRGTPTEGSYRLRGTINPEGAPAVTIDQTVEFTSEHVADLKRLTPPAATQTPRGMPTWVWLALGLAVALLAVLSFTIWKLARRRPTYPVVETVVEGS